MDNRILAIAVMAHARYVAGVDDDRWKSIDRAIEFLEFVEKDAPDIIRYHASCRETPPDRAPDPFGPAKPRTVEDWMHENDREPYCTGDYDVCFWDAPGFADTVDREALSGEVFAKLRPSSLGGGRPGKTRCYETRADAVADLRKALLSLQLIAE